jgi:hypothetical protein
MNPDAGFQAGIPAREIHALFAEAAVRASMIRPIDPMQVGFARESVTLCARVDDRYPSPECREDTVGDVIRGRWDPTPAAALPIR